MTGAPSTSPTGLTAVVRREMSRMAGKPFSLLGMVVFPILSTLVILATFGDGVVRDLPVAVVDHDASPLSRSLARMLDATPGIRVANTDSDEATAHGRILRGESYGTVVVPRHFARDVVRGQAPRVSVFYNAQYLVAASTLRRDATAAIGALSASVEAERRSALGQPPTQVADLVEPMTVETHILGNPTLGYVPYLVTGILPALLQIFIIVMAVHAFGSELRDGTAGGWIEAAGGRAWVAMAGKALPYVVFFTGQGLMMLAVIFGWLGIPIAGNPAVVAVATVLFVLAYMAMGFAAVALTGNLRLATSLAAFYSVPAFAFAGVTFPTFGMPVLGQAWGSLLPLSHYLALFAGQVLRGAPLHTAQQPLLWLAVFAVVPWAALGWRLSGMARDPRAWGRL